MQHCTTVLSTNSATPIPVHVAVRAAQRRRQVGAGRDATQWEGWDRVQLIEELEAMREEVTAGKRRKEE